MQNRDDGSSEAKEPGASTTESSEAQQNRPTDTEPAGDGLDLDRLAEALESVPLNGRLPLPKDLLLPEQIAEFERNAAHQLKSFEEKLKSIVNSEIKPDPEYDAMQQANAASADKRGDDQNGDYDDYDDDEVVDPNNVVDWLDKVLSN